MPHPETAPPSPRRKLPDPWSGSPREYCYELALRLEAGVMRNVLSVQTKREVGHAAVFVRRVADKMTDEQIRGLFK